MIPSQPERKAMVSRSVKSQSKNSDEAGRDGGDEREEASHGSPQRGRPPVAALVEPVSL